MEKVQDPSGLTFKYEYSKGLSAGYATLGESKQNEVAEILIAATLNGLSPVPTAMEHGIPQLTAATGIVSLVNEGLLKSGTLELVAINEASPEVG